MQPNDLNALAARLHVLLDCGAVAEGTQVNVGDGWENAPDVVRAAADALTAGAASVTTGADSAIRTSPSVAEAREAVRLAIREGDREIDRMTGWDIERKAMPLVDALIAAVRADVPQKVRAAAKRVLDDIADRPDHISLQDAWHDFTYGDLRALARHVLWGAL
jgi:hypothetical protein